MPHLLRAVGDAALLRLDLASMVAAASASATAVLPPTDFCMQPVLAAILLAGLLVLVSSVACACGAFTSGAAALWWLRRAPSALPPLRSGAPLPQSLQDLARIAAFIEVGGHAAVEEAAIQLRRSPASVRRCYAKWQAAAMGPTEP